MIHQITPKYSCKATDGQFKTIEQLMKTQLTIRQYGRYLADSAKKEKVNAVTAK